MLARYILEARLILERGSHWRVGNGRLIRIWQDRWLERPHLFHPLTPSSVDCEVEFVSDLIHSESASWNRDLVNELFLPCDASLALSIPLSGRLPPDKLPCDAYRVAFSLRNEASSSHPSSVGASMRRAIWEANIPGKVKMCVWRACLNVLPTRANLENKRMEVDNVCILCSYSSELALHVICDCPFARAVYFSSHLNMGPRPPGLSSMPNWMSSCVASLPSNQLAFLFILIHSIWRERNSLLWDGKIESPVLVSHLSKLQLDDFIKAKLVSHSRPIQASSHWCPPPSGWIKINVDGSFLAASNLGGVGAVFRNEAGSYAGGFVRQISSASNPTMVELLPVRDGVCWAMQKNLPRIIVESDSLQVVQAIGSLKQGASHMDLLVEDIRTSLRGFEASQVCYVRRSANDAAHHMAKLALSSP